MKFINFFKHLKKVIIHRKWVRYYCFHAGLFWQGLTHDLSKFHPTEFIESVRYYDGRRSPIDVCKERNEYSKAWLHHRGRNKHHWEYWVDNFEKGMTPIRMPYKYAVEMFCDFLGAGRAYLDKSYTAEKECAWWQEKRKVVVMHPQTKTFIDECFEEYRHRACVINPLDLKEIWLDTLRTERNVRNYEQTADRH